MIKEQKNTAMSSHGVVFTAINVEDLAGLVADKLRPHLRELMPDDEMSQQQAAHLLEVNPVTIWRWVKNGELKSHTYGRRPKVWRSDVLELKKRMHKGRLLPANDIRVSGANE